MAFVQVIVFLLMLSNGVNIPIADLLSLWRRPALLLRSLVAVILLVPLAFLIVMAAVDLPLPVAAGMALLAAAPGAPLTATRSKLVQGSIPDAAGLQLITVLLAVITTPLLLAMFHNFFALGAELEISALDVA